MTGENRRTDALNLLSRAERELIEAIFERLDKPARDADEQAFLLLARLRLRNMVEKHGEALKRARIAARAEAADPGVAVLEQQVWICSEALVKCRECLALASVRH